MLYKHNKKGYSYNMETIYNRIKLFRIEKGISRQELADLVQVNPQTIGFLEREQYNPSLSLALKIAKVFGVSVHNVFSITEFPSLLTTKENHKEPTR